MDEKALLLILVFINFTLQLISPPLSPESKVFNGFVHKDIFSICIDVSVFHSSFMKNATKMR